MPEPENTAEAVDTIEATPEPVAEKTAKATDSDLGDGGRAALAAEREARKAAERQARDLQKSLKEYEDRDKSELEKALERAEVAEKTAAEAQFSAMRSKVAAAKGVPASSLTGATEEELAASADELIAWRDQNKPPSTPTTPKRTPTSGGGLKSGASGSENTNLDPKAAAADALRRMRAGG